MDEFNDYGIRNPDGINISYTDYQRVSSFNDMRNFVQESSSNNVQETQTYQETSQARGADFRSHSQLDLTNAPDLSNATQSASGSASASASSSAAGASTAGASTAAASTAAASTTAATTAAASTAAISTAAVSVGGAIASAVTTLVVVASLVANAFTLGISFLSATYNSLSFEVNIENNEDQEEFRAVLYDLAGEIVQELTVKETQIVVFENLEENSSYTFAVYDKDEIQKFKNTYLTSTRKSYEDQINVTVTSNLNGLLSFDLFVPQVLANNVFTVRVTDESGKEWLAKDGHVESTSYSVPVPEYKDFIIKVSIDNKIVYQYKVAKATKYKAPVFDWDNIDGDIIMASFTSEDGSITKQVQGTITRTVTIPATLEEEGRLQLLATVSFEGKEYQEEDYTYIPAQLNDPAYYSFTGFEWIDNGLDYPTVSMRFASATGGEDVVIELNSTRLNSSLIDATFTTQYSVETSIARETYSATHDTVLERFEMGATDLEILDYSTGRASMQVTYMYDGLEEAQTDSYLCEDFDITDEGIVYTSAFRGIENTYTVGNSDRIYEVEGNYYSMSEELNAFAIQQVLSVDSNRTYEAPEELFGLPVTSIGYQAFRVEDGTPIESTCVSVILSKYIEEYAEGAFAYSKIENIEFYYPLTTISDEMFMYSSISIEDVLTDDVRSIGKQAFEGCEDTAIVIPDSVETIGEGAFGKMPNLTSITTAMTGMDVDAGYDTGARLEAYFATIFSDEDEWIDDLGGTACTATYVDGGRTYYYYVMNKLDVIFTGRIIPEYSFSNNDMINTITMQGVEEIGDYAFYNVATFDNYEEPTAIVIPDTVTSIGDYAFAFAERGLGYSRINYFIAFEDDSSDFLHLGDHVFSNNDAMQQIVLPDRLTSVGDGIFSGCTQIASITVPFVGKSISSNVAGTLENTIGAYYSADQLESSDAMYYVLSESGSTDSFYVPYALQYVIVTGTTIESYSFALSCTDGSARINVVLPNVRVIDEYAFYSSDIISVTIGDDINDSLQIGNYAFTYSSKIESIVLPDRLTSVGNSILMGCENLESIEAPFMGESANASGIYGTFGYYFYDPENSFTTGDRYSLNDGGVYDAYVPTTLESITTHSTTIRVNEFAFSLYGGGTGNITVYAPDVEIIEAKAFYMSNYAGISLGDSLEEIGTYAFGNAVLSSFEIGPNLQKIHESAFQGAANPTDYSATAMTVHADAADYLWDAYLVDPTTGDIPDTPDTSNITGTDLATNYNDSYRSSFYLERQS